MHALIQQLIDQEAPVITDGAWGTQLQARGLPAGAFPDEWNVLHPERVMEVPRDYVEAGSQIILTNTFGANRIRLAEVGLAHMLSAINRAGVEISLQAAAGRARVFASIGPTGKLILSGDVTPDALRDAFEEQAGILADAGADGLVIETMADLQEAELAVAAAHATGLPVVACMVFDSGRDKDRTMMGDTPANVAQALTDAGADVIGANCGQGIPGFINLCKQLRAATDRPIWLKANAGLPQLENGRVTYNVSPEGFAGYVPQLIEAGASFVGGCCGTSPAFIRAVAQIVRQPHLKHPTLA